jgi:hypothetical protein
VGTTSGSTTDDIPSFILPQMKLDPAWSVDRAAA